LLPLALFATRELHDSGGRGERAGNGPVAG
jgi:hypothetical protein